MRSKPSIAIAVLMLLVHGVVRAEPVLQKFEPADMRPGDLLEQPVKWQDKRGQRLEFKLIEAPDAARLVVNDKGELVLQWKSGPAMADTTSLVIQARDVDTLEIIDTSALVVRNALTLPFKNTGIETPLNTEIESPENTALDSPVNTNVNTTAMLQPQDQPQAGVQPLPSVSLRPPVGEIVSAGKRVKIQISGASSDDESLLISLDRIPRNASFERSGNSSYTFFWQTTDRDQGEHRFRVTAVHPDNEAATVSREFTVVVGDPSRTTTLPAEADDDSS